MRKILLASILSLAALLFLAPEQLRADGLDTFTFSENFVNVGAFTLTWQAPSNPTPDVSAPGQGFEQDGVPALLTLTDLMGNVTTESLTGSLIFFNANAGVPFQFQDIIGDAGVSLFGASQPQMYSGPEGAPIFIPGVYTGIDLFNFDANGNPNAATLTISAITTPEPASILMYLVGFLALAGMLVVRKAQG